MERKRKPGGGRKPLPDAQRTMATSVRLTKEQNKKFLALGGAEWLRRMLDAMKHINSESQP